MSHARFVMSCGSEHKYPLVAELARIMLATRASQIECERIFSLACLVTQHLRNKMGVENMAATVFITKNLNLSAEVVSILKYGLGPQAYNASLARKIYIKTKLQEARETAAVCERIVSDQLEASMESELKYHAYMESYLVDNDDECS